MENRSKKRVMSRRDFLKLSTAAGAGLGSELMLNRLTGGKLNRNPVGFIGKLLDKLRRGELGNEIQQQIEASQGSSTEVDLDTKFDVNEKWSGKFNGVDGYFVKGKEHQGKAVIFARLPKLRPEIAPHQKQGGIDIFEPPSEFLSMGTIILPAFQIEKRSDCNVSVPTNYTLVANTRETLVYKDAISKDANPRDGALIVTKGGETKFVQPENIKRYPAETVAAILTVPYAIELDLSLPVEQLENQVESQLRKIDETTPYSVNLSESEHYETFYLELDTELYLFSIYKAEGGKPWDKRLSMHQAINLVKDYAAKVNANSITLIPTDPDLNDAVLQVSDDPGWQKHSLTHKGEENLLPQPFYLTIRGSI